VGYRSSAEALEAFRMGSETLKGLPGASER
jgi:hypothetical protein